jgi:hypothetical protein
MGRVGLGLCLFGVFAPAFIGATGIWAHWSGAPHHSELLQALFGTELLVVTFLRFPSFFFAECCGF